MGLRRAEGGGARGEGNLNGPLGALVGWLVRLEVMLNSHVWDEVQLIN